MIEIVLLRTDCRNLWYLVHLENDTAACNLLMILLLRLLWLLLLLLWLLLCLHDDDHHEKMMCEREPMRDDGHVSTLVYESNIKIGRTVVNRIQREFLTFRRIETKNRYARHLHRYALARSFNVRHHGFSSNLLNQGFMHNMQIT